MGCISAFADGITCASLPTGVSFPWPSASIFVVRPIRGCPQLLVCRAGVRQATHKIHGLQLHDRIQSPRVLQSWRLIQVNGVSQRGPSMPYFPPLNTLHSSSNRPPRAPSGWCSPSFTDRSKDDHRSPPLASTPTTRIRSSESLFPGQTLLLGSPLTRAHSLSHRR